MEHKRILQLTQCALIAALAYVGFQFLRIDIPVGTERTAIHLGNTFVVLGALLLGGWGGFAGALGLTMADLTSGYLTSAPKTFLLKLVIGLIVTLVSCSAISTRPIFSASRRTSRPRWPRSARPPRWSTPLPRRCWYSSSGPRCTPPLRRPTSSPGHPPGHPTPAKPADRKCFSNLIRFPSTRLPRVVFSAQCRKTCFHFSGFRILVLRVLYHIFSFLLCVLTVI